MKTVLKGVLALIVILELAVIAVAQIEFAINTASCFDEEEPAVYHNET